MTGAGKTHTMFGDRSEKGLADLCVSGLEGSQISVCFLEIYNETVKDLLNQTDRNLNIQENQSGEIQVPELAEFPVGDSETLHEVIDYGNSRRTVAATSANKTSSRSHAILIFNVQTGNFKAKLQIVDLAGSERAA